MVSVAGALILCAPTLAGAETIDEMVRNPGSFDNRTVRVTGLVSQVESSDSFLVTAGGSTVRVVRQSGLRIRSGQRVEVYGIFRAGEQTIEAFTVTVR